MKGIVSCVSLWMCLLAGYAQQLPEEVIRYADRVFYNAQVLTMDRDGTDFSVTQAVAIRDGRIMAAGNDARILQMAGPETVKIDLAACRTFKVTRQRHN